jgi:hypothetical protein
MALESNIIDIAYKAMPLFGWNSNRRITKTPDKNTRGLSAVLNGHCYSNLELLEELVE